MLVEVEDRLLTLKPGTLRHVAGAVEFAALEKGVIADAILPAAFVLPLSFASAPSTTINHVRQMSRAGIAVVLAAKNLRDARGFTASKELEALFAAVRAKLLGWSPEAAFGPFTHVRGEAVSFQHGVVWWQEEFTADTLISQE